LRIFNHSLKERSIDIMSENFQIQYNNELKDVEADWVRIYDCSTLSYFCSLNWHKVVLAFLQKTLITKRRNKIKYFTITNGDEINVLGFFFIRNYKGQRKIIFGHLLGPSDYYDFVYSDIANLKLTGSILTKIMDDHKATAFSMGHVKQHSLLYNWMTCLKPVQINPLACVAITLPNEFKDYLNLLSTNAKQNLRTAQNRLRKNNLHTDFSLLGRNDLEKIDFQSLKRIYKDRNRSKEGSQSWQSKLYVNLDSIFKGYPDMFDLMETLETDFSLGVLRINGNLAAYFFGFCKKQSIEINRVAIVHEYKFYSPGILLFHEFIKNHISKGLRVVDLTVGDEKYKYDLGGKTHEVFNITFEK